GGVNAHRGPCARRGSAGCGGWGTIGVPCRGRYGKVVTPVRSQRARWADGGWGGGGAVPAVPVVRPSRRVRGVTRCSDPTGMLVTEQSQECHGSRLADRLRSPVPRGYRLPVRDEHEGPSQSHIAVDP